MFGYLLDGILTFSESLVWAVGEKHSNYWPKAWGQNLTYIRLTKGGFTERIEQQLGQSSIASLFQETKLFSSLAGVTS